MHRVVLVVAAAVLTVVSSSLSAQQLESFAGLRLRFESPGARSAAMGGASEALSDSLDAIDNPAALAHQRELRAAVEARQTSSETEYVTGGTVGSFTSATFDNSSRGVQSAIVILPAARATWALYYDEPVAVSADTTGIPRGNGIITIGIRGNELVPESDCSPMTQQCFLASFSAPVITPLTATLRVRRYGGAAATSIGRLSLGGAVQYAQLDEAAESFGDTQHASGGRWTWNAGAQYALATRVRLGTSYRSGASHEADRRMRAGDAVMRVEAAFRTPSSYGAGLAVDLSPNLTFAADAVRVRYSETDEARFYVDSPGGAIYYHFPDVTELHAGVEYRLPTRVPVALRAGWWSDPAHRARAAGGFPGFAESINTVMLPDRDENHVTAGIGVGSRVRLDAALDRSERTTRASVGVGTTF